MAYWTRKETARSNFEVIRTICSVAAVLLNLTVLLGLVFGWL